jgi:hypothetical protein
MYTNPAPVPVVPPSSASFLDNGSSLCTGGLTSPDSLDAIPTNGLLPAGSSTTPFAAPAAGAGPDSSIPPSIYTLPLIGGNALSFNGGGAGVIAPPLTQPQPPIGAEEVTQAYTGSDMRVMLTLSDPTGCGQNLTRQLVELTTLTVSIHRVKSAARACGYINPRGFARHGRTIAGTMILTQFTLDVLARFLYPQLSTDLSKDSIYVKADQLPPFDLTLMFSDEYGNASYRRLLCVDIVDDGTVYSQNDMFAEQTLSYMAADFTPLLPLTQNALLNVDPTSAAAAQQTSPSMVMPQPSAAELNLIDPQTPAVPSQAPAPLQMPPSVNDADDPDTFAMPYSPPAYI